VLWIHPSLFIRGFSAEEKSLMTSFGLGDVEEEGDATDGVHDEDLGKHDANDAGGEAVVNQDPVDRRNNL